MPYRAAAAATLTSRRKALAPAAAAAAEALQRPHLPAEGDEGRHPQAEGRNAARAVGHVLPYRRGSSRYPTQPAEQPHLPHARRFRKAACTRRTGGGQSEAGKAAVDRHWSGADPGQQPGLGVVLPQAPASMGSKHAPSVAYKQVQRRGRGGAARRPKGTARTLAWWYQQGLQAAVKRHVAQGPARARGGDGATTRRCPASPALITLVRRAYMGATGPQRRPDRRLSACTTRGPEFDLCRRLRLLSNHCVDPLAACSRPATQLRPSCARLPQTLGVGSSPSRPPHTPCSLLQLRPIAARS